MLEPRFIFISLTIQIGSKLRILVINICIFPSLSWSCWNGSWKLWKKSLCPNSLTNSISKFSAVQVDLFSFVSHLANLSEISLLSNPIYHEEIFSILFASIHKMADYFAVSDVVMSLLLFLESSASQYYLLLLVLNFPNDFSNILQNLIQLSLQLGKCKTNQSMTFKFFPCLINSFSRWRGLCLHFSGSGCWFEDLFSLQANGCSQSERRA
jgi:hypothetical protein